MKRHRSFAVLVLIVIGLTSCEVEDVTLVKLTKVEIDRLENQEMFLDVSAILDNPNSFSIKVKDSDFDLYMEDRYIGKANLENKFTLESGSEKEYDLEIRAIGDKLNAEMLPIMLTAALTGKVNVRLDGTITGKVFFITRSLDVDIQEEVIFNGNN
jgi:LEA14-like dessication related protein